MLGIGTVSHRPDGWPSQGETHLKRLRERIRKRIRERIRKRLCNGGCSNRALKRNVLKYALNIGAKMRRALMYALVLSL